MKVFTTDKIRNVVLLGHGSCGKTTLVEALSLVSKATSRMGKVEDGNTISDYTKEEQKRQFSIGTSVIPIVFDNHKINILDTPGYFDFVGEVEEAVSAADAAIIVISGKAGVEAGTMKAWDICEKYKLPRMFFVTDMDIDNASFRQAVEDLTQLYGKKIAPFYQPIRENEKFVGYVNVIKNAGRKFIAPGSREECEIPDYCKDNLELYRNSIMEAVAETSEEFLNRYLDGDSFTVDEIRAATTFNVDDCNIFPVSMGSSLELRNIHNLLNDIIKYFPSPDKCEKAGIDSKTSGIFEANYDFSKTKSANIFKTIVDPFIGKYSLIKVNSGVLKSDDTLYNSDTDSEERINKLYVMIGGKTEEVPELHAGDIGALAKLNDAKTGHSLSTKAHPIVYPKTDISKPYTCMRYEVENKADMDKVAQALQKLSQEDTTLQLINDSENHQSLIYGMGDLHLEVITSRLVNEYKVNIKLSKPKVAYKETIRKKSDVEHKYKKQSGGHGQYGHVKMTFEPSGDLETSFVFEQTVVGGTVPKNYFPAVEKGLQESVLKGPLASYPVVGIKAVLYDGSYHPVDSSEMAFKTASSMAFKDGIMKADPVLLEPIMTLKVVVPDKYTGDVMGDLNKKRGRVLGMNPIGGDLQEIQAEIPQSELYGYSTTLRSMTGGMGVYSYEFVRYEQAPSDVQQKEVAARANEGKEE